MSFSKVNIGLRPNGTNQKGRFNLGCDFHFTTNFGRIVPIYAHEFPAGSHIDVDINSLVRMSALSVPTAGRLHLNHYHCYVPYKEVYKPFDALLSNTSYNFNGLISKPKLNKYTYRTLCHSFLGKICAYTSNIREQLLRYDTLYVVNNAGVRVTNSDLEEIYLNFFDQDFPVSPRIEICVGANQYYEADSQGNISTVSNGGDMFTYPSPTAYDYKDTYTSATGTFTIYLKYSPYHTRMLQILVGLGYPYDPVTDDVSILPLLCYYYSIFKVFGIERTTNIESTYFATIKSNLNQMNGYSIPFETLSRFFQELFDTCYTFAPDYYTSQIISVNDNQDSSKISSYSSVTNNTTYGAESSTAGSATNLNDSLGQGSSNSLAQTIAKRMLRFVNENTVFGKSVEKYLRSLYPGIQFDPKHDVFVGASRVPISIDEIWNMANTDESYLGEFAGKGKGGGNSKHISYDTKYPGIFITFSCVVPENGYYQGYNPMVKRSDRFDFANPEFDALGYTPTTDHEFICDSVWLTGSIGTPKVIGLKPRYQDYKWHQNVITGSLRSNFYRDSYRGYFLDREFSGDIGNLKNETLRTLSDTNDYFNLNRIFYDTNSQDDHFICLNVINLTAYMPLLPIEETFVDSDVDKAGNVVVNRS